MSALGRVAWERPASAWWGPTAGDQKAQGKAWGVFSICFLTKCFFIV